MSIAPVGGAGLTWFNSVSPYATRPSATEHTAAPASEDGQATASATRNQGQAEDSSARSAPPGEGKADLSDPERRQVAQLADRDREVRAHEMAHVAAGGGLVTRGASYSYQTGPDGQRYAIGGEVGIDTSAGKTPEETLAKAERIRAAALAPAEPSGQDRQVAAMAARMASEAQMEIARREFTRGGSDARADEAREGAGSSYRARQAEQAYASGAAPHPSPEISTTA